MTITPLVPDVAPQRTPAQTPDGGFARALDDLGQLLDRADASENAFAAGAGSLTAAVYDRARADVALAVAEAAAQRASQSINTLLNMQL